MSRPSVLPAGLPKCSPNAAQGRTAPEGAVSERGLDGASTIVDLLNEAPMKRLRSCGP